VFQYTLLNRTVISSESLNRAIENNKRKGQEEKFPN